jgi:hypothetical protein
MATTASGTAIVALPPDIRRQLPTRAGLYPLGDRL